MSKPAATPLDFRNTNTLWCSTLVAVLVRLGARRAVTCPGSRSTPLTMALVREKRLTTTPVLDERSAGFFALGVARRERRPTILVCTSGTAAANFLPAVIEARESGVPLLVITADRPPEMRECRSGQTIDQQKLYGDFVGFYHELSVPEPSLELLRYLRQTVIQAWERTLGPQPGPVHLNAPFRDPLPPTEDGRTATVRREMREEEFFALVTPTAPASSQAGGTLSMGALPADRSRRRGVIVVGPAQPAAPVDYCRWVAQISRNCRWPVLADALSPLRNQARLNPEMVTTYDLLLREESRAAELRPDFVLCLGGWPTSKRLREWLQAGDPETVMVAGDSRNLDALHLRTRHLRVSVGELARSLGPTGAGNAAWLGAWRRAESAARRLLDREMRAQRTLFEGKASWLLAQKLPRGTPVVVANSMPVRDAEYFWQPNNRGGPVYCNRGANGIDGTLSTALGVADAGRPAVLLTGDLALLHDTNGFLLAPKFQGSLTVVLINNEGGGIFEHLPVAKFDPPFEEYFATPQRVDFSRLCAAYGLEHVRVRSWAHLGGLVAKLPARGLRVLELRTNRKRDAARRQRLFRELAAGLALPPA